VSVKPIALLFAHLIVAPVGAAVIDDFSVGEVQVLGPQETVNQSPLDPASVIGGTRRITVNQNAMNLSISDGSLVASRTGDWGYFTLEYGFDAPLGVDLKANGHDRLRLTFNSEGSEASNGIATFSIKSQSPAGGDIPRLWLTDVQTGGIVEIPFSAYVADLSNVANIAIDVFRMQGGFSLESIETTGPQLSGDFNRDGVIDQRDLEPFNLTFGRKMTYAGAYLTSDANRDGRVDGGDFLDWQRAYAANQSASSALVPEPTVACLTLLAGLTLHLVKTAPSRRLRRPQG
jgi:hypothetical protein